MTTPQQTFGTARGASSEALSESIEGTSLVENVSRETIAVMRATYSPEDNKLRLYAATRLDAGTYARVKEAGFRWAPKQGLFFAQEWTPSRADLLIDFCGVVDDEDTSLVDRAEERAERFEEYQAKRAADAVSARNAVAAIAGNIPLGQPILVGHHSERHARRDAQRIENGMRRAVQMWDTSEYWKSRAAGAIRHAKYKELPAVRARRIKIIEADRRRAVRNLEQCEQLSALWMKLEEPSKTGNPADAALIRRRALFIANHDHVSQCFHLSEYPRELPVTQYEGEMSVWSALEGGIITPEQAREIATRVHARRSAWAQRWIAHYDIGWATNEPCWRRKGRVSCSRRGSGEHRSCRRCATTARPRVSPARTNTVPARPSPTHRWR